jgi:hypothetical protein
LAAATVTGVTGQGNGGGGLSGGDGDGAGGAVTQVGDESHPHFERSARSPPPSMTCMATRPSPVRMYPACLLHIRYISLSPGCRAVELSRLCRGSVEPLSRPLSRPCLSSLVEPVEFLSSLSRLTPCAGASSCCRGLSSFSVEARGCRVMSECAVELQLEHGM